MSQDVKITFVKEQNGKYYVSKIDRPLIYPLINAITASKTLLNAYRIKTKMIDGCLVVMINDEGEEAEFLLKVSAANFTII